MSKLMMVVAVLLMSFGAHAESEVVDGVTWSYTIWDGKANVYSGLSSSPAISPATVGAIAIPSTLGGSPVTSIGDGAFYGCFLLTAVSIPSTVTSIGSSAFSGCSGLTSVTIPEGVMSIGTAAFSGCCGLTSMTIPSSITSIMNLAFTGCSGLIQIAVAAGNKNYKVVNNCLVTIDGASLVAVPLGCDVVDVPAGITQIPSSMFYADINLRKVIIPEGAMSIGGNAFAKCTELRSITIPKSLRSTGDFAFDGCSGLIQVDIVDLAAWCGIDFGASGNPLAYAGHLYLAGEEVVDLVIPDGVTSIGYVAFNNCKGIRSVTFSPTVANIGAYAFSDCCGLASVVIPSSVMSIGRSAFYNCSGLKSVEFLGVPPEGVSDSYLLSYGIVGYPREYGAEWLKIINLTKFNGYGQLRRSQVEIVSAAIREKNPSVMDVVYKVKSAKAKVKVRALVFQDGERSFAKVVRPKEFIEDTAKNIGDEIVANEEHKLSWRVSADWKVDLAKVKFEVLAMDGELLPLELITIPKTANHAAMEISWNAITVSQVLDALLWLYADGDEELQLKDGQLRNGATTLVYGMSFAEGGDGSLSARRQERAGTLGVSAVSYVFSKMGFLLLSGDELGYANKMTRLGLSPANVYQYAWRTVEE